VVSLARSREYDFGVIAVSPLSYARGRILQFALILVPIGAICGLLIAWLIYRLALRSMGLPSVLRTAARRKEFRVEYQPIVNLETGRWGGAEALVRWRRDGLDIRPDVFIPVAEESGLITEITACVMEIVARDLPRLTAIDSDFYVAINLSSADLKSAGIVDRVYELAESGVRSRNLTVEATERGFLDGKEVRGTIARLRSRGVRVAIDDFGTGYSSLASLQKLEIDTLKIDKSFVDTIGTDGATSGVVAHIIRLARSLNLGVVAEGVERESQAVFLRESGVPWAQGWYFAKAMPIDALCETLGIQRLQHEVA
jgi:sensor c-di-GMP phosphodiesterase-like protein